MVMAVMEVVLFGMHYFVHLLYQFMIARVYYSDLPLYPAFFGDGYNPVALANKTDNKEIEYRVFANLYAEYKITKNLKFKSDVGLDAIITMINVSMKIMEQTCA